jgi:hypothetical protein
MRLVQPYYPLYAAQSGFGGATQIRRPAPLRSLCCNPWDFRYQAAVIPLLAYRRYSWYIQNMTGEEKYAYWLELAQYDLESAEAMYSSGSKLYYK